ncbi:hypothetical protein P171DRAFT_139631 [Karstenula rhodostoma CBS 690.94]|uniref:Uncharacterized protein n=1 Tax=Karstenula rhodostoma CBS 690.94 TaxID=1392251 RepID=A0A9P4PSB4_9PLEO|nr:hypothetical protein P171DRAFT_139631 [Karstenula rhodostoma CBS 690.94]
MIFRNPPCAVQSIHHLTIFVWSLSNSRKKTCRSSTRAPRPIPTLIQPPGFTPLFVSLLLTLRAYGARSDGLAVIVTLFSVNQ